MKVREKGMKLSAQSLILLIFTRSFSFLMHKSYFNLLRQIFIILIFIEDLNYQLFSAEILLTCTIRDL